MGRWGDGEMVDKDTRNKNLLHSFRRVTPVVSFWCYLEIWALLI
ncbi:hypothetical protein [Okeania sp. SIO2F5]|nr:hypothetical protein [Okeania sp. SIO2F5]